MPIPWNEDRVEDRPRIEANLRRLLAELARGAPLREPPSVTMACEWHRRVYDGVRLPVAYYAGQIRDSDPDHPELVDYEVAVGEHRGVRAKDVPVALELFERQMQERIAALDEAVRARRSSRV